MAVEFARVNEAFDAWTGYDHRSGSFWAVMPTAWFYNRERHSMMPAEWTLYHNGEACFTDGQPLALLERAAQFRFSHNSSFVVPRPAVPGKKQH
ncbi:hypothetical protein [Prosthecochloris sp.]|uniref:hypothetical protein n=1 Tax=Prosthecochloris sp. TaxID=290513 RepID=UPI0025DFEE31|nr:hypothetical protein [Prosthecochloris sp.]